MIRALRFVFALNLGCVLAASLAHARLRAIGGAFLDQRFAFFEGLFVTPHQLSHFAAFGILGMQAAVVASDPRMKFLTLGGVIAFGFIGEFLEYAFSADRFETWDCRDDTLAACMGFALILLACSVRKQRAVREGSL